VQNLKFTRLTPHRPTVYKPSIYVFSLLINTF